MRVKKRKKRNYVLRMHGGGVTTIEARSMAEALDIVGVSLVCLVTWKDKGVEYSIHVSKPLWV